jgi:FlaA1/EpsC-like NDP-sugar epimerase
VVPRAVLIIDPILIFLLMGGGRFIYRFWKEQVTQRSTEHQSKPVLVLGSGVAAVSLSMELAHSHDWSLVAFLDDDLTKHGRTINGVKVIGSLDTLPYWADRLGVKRAIIAMPSASLQLRGRLIEMCKKADVEVFSMPSLDDLLRGRDSTSHLSHVDLDDLLGRAPVQLDTDGLAAFLRQKTVFVTGAGGSIGSELCRQIALFKPKILVMVELNEFALYKLEQELIETNPDFTCKFLLGDVRDFSRIDEILTQYQPDVVFHAAAYKHVPLLELDNAWQAMRNNVLGTWTVATLAQRHRVGKFVLISTDKAVNPTNVMGASKRLAEKICQGLQKNEGTNFVVVRFGNVLGSTGSVIPKFREQIAKGGPITVTHPEITRYFMSIPEAAQLVLQAGMMGKKAEIFVLDMGEPVKIVNLAKNLIRLSGLSEEEIKIVYSGLRPGEKLYEELLSDKELTLPTEHAKLRIARAQLVNELWLGELMVWINTSPTCENKVSNVKTELLKWVPEYQPDYL